VFLTLILSGYHRVNLGAIMRAPLMMVTKSQQFSLQSPT
jgi:hypothetical protein